MADNIQEKIENIIIDEINAGAGGRLIIFKPEKTIFNADLAAERRGKYKEKEMYFQINAFITPAKSETFIKDFPQESFKADKNFYLFFLQFDKVRQEISDYLWLIPSLQFADIAEVIKSPNGNNLLRFEAPLDFKQKNKYSEFIASTKELGKLILDAFEKGGKFNLAGGPFEEKISINLESLKDFLLDARKNTYAADGGAIDNPRLLGSTQLEFQKGDYIYRDIYFSGDKKFIGQEVIYQDLKPVWGMNYIGDAIGKLETNFLKESLFKLAEKCRLGQTCEYEKREFKYQDKGQGDLKYFSGQEQIFNNGKNIYKLDYKGGILSEKT